MLLPLLLSVIAPVKLLPALPSVIAFAPAVKDEVPGTTIAPVCVMLPPDVMLRF